MTPTSQPSQANAAVLTSGVRLKERYRVRGVLGSGGFSVVYDGEDEQMGRPVAIKVLNALPATIQINPERKARALARFDQEARLAAKLEHPNVVTIFDTGTTTHGQPFLIMERLFGHTLSEELTDHGPMEPSRLLPMFCEALEGLGVAHSMGVVHKDLKPSNLFLVQGEQEPERIYVVDFGVARLDVEGETLTGSDQLSGTPQYMAPEYIQHMQVSPAVDVYQMGLILSELLTGRRPVNGPLAACMLQHIHEQLDIPEQLLATPLGPILRRATALNPQNRYSNAMELREDLLTVDPTSVPPFNPQEANAPPKRTADYSASTLSPMRGVARSAPLSTLVKKPAPAELQPAQGAPGSPNLRFAAIVALLLGIVGTAWYINTPPASSPPETTGASATNNASFETSAPYLVEPIRAETTASTPPQTTQGASTTATRPVTTPPPSKSIAVEIRTTPCQAVIFAGHTKLGIAPLTVEFDSADAPGKRLTAMCRGRKRLNVLIQPSHAPMRMLRLTPRPLPLPE